MVKFPIYLNRHVFIMYVATVFITGSPKKTVVLKCQRLNQWMKIFNNTENITQLILDCTKFVDIIRESTLVKLTKATTELCYRLHIVRLDKSD